MKFPKVADAYIDFIKDWSNRADVHPNDAARAGAAFQNRKDPLSAEVGKAYRDRFGKSIEDTVSKLVRRTDYIAKGMTVAGLCGLSAGSGVAATAAIEHKKISKLKASRKADQNQIP